MAGTAALELGLEVMLSRACRRPFETPSGHVVRCGSRLKAECEGCSALHVGDWRSIIRSGVFDAGTGYRFFLLTLTAPSFGAVHHVPREPGKRDLCKCGKRHSNEVDAGLRGVPVDLADYDYAGQVAWNAASGRLWDATRARLRALLPSLAFASVREWQARGALHLHVLIRVEAKDAQKVPVVQAGKKRRSVPVITALVGAVTARGDDGITVCWGANVDCRPVRADQATGRTIWYLTKAVGYLTKDVADGGGGHSLAGVEHWRRMDHAARRHRCPGCQRRRHRVLACGALLHRQWGARSHVVSVSRPSRDGSRPGWSLTGLTRARQREARLKWVRENFPMSESEIREAATARLARNQEASALLAALARKRKSATQSLVSVTASAGPPSHAG
ncbi:replication initiator [Nocardioides sp. R-C-SC26]|uniref:replication initiator n=1 Tax=Nocardioides sp. R-C-SC26 TaxID=2870414 RepID=UPI0035AB6A39